eukprot:COSAG05_NODE_3510_length_2018_cov_63.361360_2_plen_128_part_00
MVLRCGRVCMLSGAQIAMSKRAAEGVSLIFVVPASAGVETENYPTTTQAQQLTPVCEGYACALSVCGPLLSAILSCSLSLSLCLSVSLALSLSLSGYGPPIRSCLSSLSFYTHTHTHTHTLRMNKHQ